MYLIQIKVEELNDSKYIGMCIYNVVILSIMGVAINYLVSGRINISYAFTSIIIIAGTTLTQTLVFVPKVGYIIVNTYYEGVIQKYAEFCFNFDNS